MMVFFLSVASGIRAAPPAPSVGRAGSVPRPAILHTYYGTSKILPVSYRFVQAGVGSTTDGLVAKVEHIPPGLRIAGRGGLAHGRQWHALWLRSDRGPAASLRDPVRHAESGLELPWAARLAGQLREQPARDDRVHARGDRGGHGAWLREGHGPADGRDRPQRGRPAPQRDGRLLLLPRPRAGARAGRGRPHGRGPAAA